ncbi:MAG: hypothetical protein J5634_02460 [Bacilli bacterium]|nr:hypothetical protein [Bacilli bacterium]
MKERENNDNAYSHYDSLINDHVLDVEVDKNEILSNKDELDELFKEEESYDRESEDKGRNR